MALASYFSPTTNSPRTDRPASLLPLGGDDADYRKARLRDCMKRLAIAETMLAGTREDLQLELAAVDARIQRPDSFSKADSDPEGDESLDIGYNGRRVSVDMPMTPASGCSQPETPWAPRPAGRKEGRRTLHKKQQVNIEVHHKGISPKLLRRFIRKESAEQEACLSLPQTLAQILLTLLAFQYHFQFEVLRAFDRGHAEDVNINANFAFSGILPFENGRMGHKNIQDVHSIPDFWSWFTIGLLPLWFPSSHTWGVNEVRANVDAACAAPYGALATYGYSGTSIAGVSNHSSPIWPGNICPASDEEDTIQVIDKVRDMQIFDISPNYTATYRQFNSIIGGVRMRQEQIDNRDCSLVPQLQGKLHTGVCTIDLQYFLQPEKHQAIRTKNEFTNKPDGEDIYLLSRWTLDQALQEARQLENRGWFNPTTNRIELMFPTFNAHTGVMTATFISIFNTRTGHLHKLVESFSFFVDPYASNVLTYVWDILWVSLVMKIFVEEVYDLCKKVCKHGLRTGLNEYWSLSNFVDWLTVFFAVGIAAAWTYHLFNLRTLMDILQTARVEEPGSWSDPEDRVKFFKTLHDVILHTHSFRVALGMYPFMLVVRLFKAFHVQPRLAIVTKTIQRALIDIFHFVVVFGSAFAIFAISSHFLFGQELDDFANIPRATHSTFRTLLGDFDWDELAHVGRPQAYVWFWSLTWGVQLILLNMMLGIVLDVYSEVRKEILSRKGVETLWSQAYEIWVRKKLVYTGGYVPLKKILRILNPDELESNSEDDEDEGEDPITVATFLNIVPGMKEEQAEKLLRDVVEFYEPIEDSLHKVQNDVRKTYVAVESLKKEAMKKGSMLFQI